VGADKGPSLAADLRYPKGKEKKTAIQKGGRASREGLLILTERIRKKRNPGERTLYMRHKETLSAIAKKTHKEDWACTAGLKGVRSSTKTEKIHTRGFTMMLRLQQRKLGRVDTRKTKKKKSIQGTWTRVYWKDSTDKKWEGDLWGQIVRHLAQWRANNQTMWHKSTTQGS